MVPPWFSKDFPLILEVFRKVPDRFPKFPILVSTMLKLYTMFLVDTKLNAFPSFFSDWFIPVYIIAFDKFFYGCTQWSLVNVNIISFCQWKFSSVFGNRFMENIKVNMKYTRIFFFLIGIHSIQGWTATTTHGVTRKETQKRLQDTENLFRKNLQLKDVC